MGVVFLAYDSGPLSRSVALKTLRHEFDDPHALDLFYRECAALKSITHPNIVDIFDMGEFEENGRRKPFFVMPVLDGQSLDKLIRSASDRLTVDRVVDIITQTCKGLQAAHEHGLIHRDLKPSNIFVMRDDAVKIIDFGIAHALSAQSRTRSVGKGTLPYMAPELIDNRPVSPQSDIYALGVTLYETLTRRHPFVGPTEEAVAHAILHETPPLASKLNPAVTHFISQVAHKAMAKRPSHRFATAQAFGHALRKAARNEPVFPNTLKQQRIVSASRALEKGDVQAAHEIVSELESEGHNDPQIAFLRSEIDKTLRQITVAQLLASARALDEVGEDKLAVNKIDELLQLDPTNATALELKRSIYDRRYEAQVEESIRSVRQFLGAHAYGRARDAAQQALRPDDPRLSKLLNDIDVAEQESRRIQRQKNELFQSAVNASKNGEVSAALSQMRAVLELEKKVPDISPEVSAGYRRFHDALCADVEAIDTACAAAQRHLGAKQFAEALQVCTDCLSRYPGEARLHLLKSDIEERHRQQRAARERQQRESARTSWIRQIDVQLAADHFVNANELLDAALAEFPGDAALLERRRRSQQGLERLGRKAPADQGPERRDQDVDEPAAPATPDPGPARTHVHAGWRWIGARPLQSLATVVIAVGLLAGGSWLLRTDSPQKGAPPLQPLDTKPPKTTPPEVSALTFRGLPAGLEVSVDGVRIGSIGSGGTLSYEGITPGRHTITFTNPEYEPLTIERDFGGSMTLTLSPMDVPLVRAPARVEFLSDDGIGIIVSQTGKPIRRLTGPGRLSLPEGTYTVSAVGPAGVPASRQLVVSAGSTSTMDVRTFLVRGIEVFDLTRWTQSDGWFTPPAGLVLSRQPVRNGRFTFTVRRRRSNNVFSNDSRLRWVVGHVDNRTQVLLQLDRKAFYRADLVDGGMNPMQVEHRIGNVPFLHLSVQVIGDRLIHQYSGDGKNWANLDDWTRTLPSRAGEPGRRTPFEGRFGLLVADNAALLISNFLYYPETR